MTHLLKWDVRVERRWHPIYTLGRGVRYEEDPEPPIGVSISVEFDDDAAALEFEAAVRALLEAA